MSKITTQPQSSPPLREYTLADLHALLAAIRSAIAAREDAEVRAAVPPPPPQDAPDTSADASPSAIATTPAPAVIKYMHPSNRNLTWTGDGARPAWIDTYLAQGGSWIALQNTAEKLARR